MDSLQKISAFLLPSDYFFLLPQHLGIASCAMMSCSTFHCPHCNVGGVLQVYGRKRSDADRMCLIV